MIIHYYLYKLNNIHFKFDIYLIIEKKIFDNEGIRTLALSE